ncbi:MAG TPA: LysM domain-containing protein [Candidatus Limnocylindrales bacterium]|jgi:hypothetical protein
MTTAVEFLESAQAIASKAKGYGEKALNGLEQRGPDYFDCIGFVRACLLAKTRDLWPGEEGGGDSWTVPNFLYWWNALRLGPDVHMDLYPTSTPLAADLLIFGNAEHIGIAVDAAHCLSALNPALGIRVVPTEKIALPLTHILRTGLVQAAAAPKTPAPAHTYTVVPGDTLSAIAGRHGTTWLALYTLNAALIGPSPNLIRPGQVLVLP